MSLSYLHMALCVQASRQCDKDSRIKEPEDSLRKVCNTVGRVPEALSYLNKISACAAMLAC